MDAVLELYAIMRIGLCQLHAVLVQTKAKQNSQLSERLYTYENTLYTVSFLDPQRAGELPPQKRQEMRGKGEAKGEEMSAYSTTSMRAWMAYSPLLPFVAKSRSSALLAFVGSACSILPYSSQCSLSSTHA